jgi:hypothetical protein
LRCISNVRIEDCCRWGSQVNDVHCWGNGGSAITNYKYSIDGTTYTALSPTDASSPITIPGLTNGTVYTIFLKAVNANGDSSASSSVSVTPVAPVVSTSDSSGPDNYFEPIRKVEVSNGKI